MRWGSLLAIPLMLLGVVAGWAQPYPGFPPPPQMTTPTAGYCLHLRNELARVQAQGFLLDGEARVLAVEGARMCDAGQFRGGVGRLRRALHMLRGGVMERPIPLRPAAPPPPPPG